MRRGLVAISGVATGVFVMFLVFVATAPPAAAPPIELPYIGDLLQLLCGHQGVLECVLNALLP
jgi:hypothetical protein